MKFILKLLFISILFFTFPSNTNGQSGEWTVTTSSGDTLRSCIIREVVGDGVNIICGVSFMRISVNSLSTLIKRKESPFWKGAKYGTLSGVIVGVIGGLVSYPESPGKYAKYFGKSGYAAAGGLEGAAVGFLIGGIVGAIIGGEDTKYDLSQKSKEEKIEILKDIL